MNQEEIFNNLLVMLFNEILDVEQKALITGSFKEISINDMHIIDAIGVKEPKNMGTVAKAMAVTMGTLTTAINNLVKKGYVTRVRSAEDKRACRFPSADGADGHGWIPGRGTGCACGGAGKTEGLFQRILMTEIWKIFLKKRKGCRTFFQKPSVKFYK